MYIQFNVYVKMVQIVEILNIIINSIEFWFYCYLKLLSY